MDAQDLKILGVIVGVAIARWLLARPPDRTPGPEWGADYRARHPPPPSLATVAGRTYGRLVVAFGRMRRQ